MNLVELDQALRKLRLSGMADVIETRLLQAQTEQMAPIDLLAALVSDELQRREDRLLARRHKQARFRDPDRSLDGFDFAFEPLAKLLGSRLGSVLRFSGVNTHCSGFRLCVLVLKDRRQARRRKPRGSTCFPPSVGTPVGD